MAELNLDPIAPLKIEPQENLLQKAGGYLKKTFWDDPNARQEAIYQEAQKEATPGKRFLKGLGGGAMEDLKNRAAQLYALGNTVGMGGYDAIVKALSRATKSTAYDKLKQFQKEHQAATDVGNVGGMIASIAVPSGSGFGLAAKGAKALGMGKTAAALGKVAGVASGATKLGRTFLGRAGGAALRGGLAGLEQALPRGIAEAVETGDVGKAAKNAALGVGLSAGLGGGLQVAGEGLKGLGKLGRKFAEQQGYMRGSGDVIGPLKEGLRKTRLSQLMPGFNARDLTKSLNESAGNLGIKSKAGYIVNNAEDLEKGLYDFAENTGMRNPKDFAELLQGQGPLWDKAYEKAAEAGARPIQTIKESLAEHPAMQGFIEDYGQEGLAYIDKLTKKVDRAGNNIRAVKATLDKEIRQAGKMSAFNDMYSEAQPVLIDLKHAVDSAVMDYAPELAGLQKNYAVTKPLQRWAARMETMIPAAAKESATAPRQLMAGLLGNAGPFAGMAIGGIPGALAGMVAGNVINKGLPKITGFLKGELAGKALDMLKNPKTEEALRKGIGAIKGIAGGVGKIGAALPEVLPKIAGAAPSLLSKAESTETPKPEDAKESAQAVEAVTEPAQAEEAKAEVNSRWADKVAENVQNAYVDYDVASLGFSYDEFLGAIKKVTNDFDPTISADIVFPDKGERTAFLKDYERALQYKSINVSEALTPGGFFPSSENKSSRGQLQDFMARIAGQDPMLMDPKKKKLIDATINRIAKMKGSAADKQSALLRELQANYGIDFARLADLGLLGVA